MNCVRYLLACFLLLGGCGNSSSSSSSSSSSPSSSSGSVSTENVEAALRAIPADVSGVITIASPITFWDFLTDGGFLPMDDGLASVYRDELQKHLDTHLGINISKTSSLVAGISGDSQASGVAVAYPVSGTLKGGSEELGASIVRIQGEFVVALKGKHLLAGPYRSVQAALQVLAGDGKSVLDTGKFADFIRGQSSGAYFSISVDIQKLPVPPNPVTGRLTYSGFRVVGDGMRMELNGEHDALEALRSQLEAVIEEGLSIIKEKKFRSSEEPVEGAIAIAAYYNVMNLSRILDPKVEGDRMTVELSSSGALLLVGGVGVLAAVAVPAFMKYMSKSKSSEANQFLRKMSNAVRTYYSTPEFSQANTLTGGIAEKKFPPSVGPTPPLGSCCASGEEKCIPTPGMWDDPAWLALDFAMVDPHYYSYEFVSREVDGVLSFTALAYGDLDCDGEYSTFSLYGQVIAGEVQTAGDVMKINPLE